LGYQHHTVLRINEDSIADLSLGSVLIMQDNVSHLYLYAAPNSRNHSSILSKKGNGQSVYGYDGFPLVEGQVIDSTFPPQLTWITYPYNAILADITEQNEQPVFDGLWKSLQRHYLSFQILIAGKKHFGWICISHEVGSDVLTIHDLAYNTIPGQAIKAGQRNF